MFDRAICFVRIKTIQRKHKKCALLKMSQKIKKILKKRRFFVVGAVLLLGTLILGVNTLAAEWRARVPFLSQGDSRWRYNRMHGCDGSTIGGYGCALVSATMVFNYFRANTDPNAVNTCLSQFGDYTCPFMWGPAARHCSNERALFMGFREFSYSTLERILLAGRPPIIRLSRTNGTTHFVVVTSVSGDGNGPDDFTINDPCAISRTPEVDGVIRELRIEDYINNGWTPDGIREFSRSPR